MHIIKPVSHREFRVLYPTATIGPAVGTAVGGLSTSVLIQSPSPDEHLPQPSRAIEGAASEHPPKRKPCDTLRVRERERRKADKQARAAYRLWILLEDIAEDEAERKCLQERLCSKTGAGYCAATTFLAGPRASEEL